MTRTGNTCFLVQFEKTNGHSVDSLPHEAKGTLSWISSQSHNKNIKISQEQQKKKMFGSWENCHIDICLRAWESIQGRVPFRDLENNSPSCQWSICGSRFLHNYSSQCNASGKHFETFQRKPHHPTDMTLRSQTHGEMSSGLCLRHKRSSLFPVAGAAWEPLWPVFLGPAGRRDITKSLTRAQTWTLHVDTWGSMRTHIVSPIAEVR